MSSYAMNEYLTEMFFCMSRLALCYFSVLFVIITFISKKRTHIVQAIVLAGIAVYNSFSAIPVFTYLSLFIMTLLFLRRSFDIVEAGNFFNLPAFKIILFMSTVIIAIWGIMGLGLLGFFIIYILRIDPMFSL
ncbi:hypothetical protein [Photobacterium profundum]|nr:hypothetical protein [Photobacterium profundum]